MELFVIILATAFNFAILRHKLQLLRLADTFFDVLIMVVLAWLFKGTMTGMVVAMGAGSLISIYLLFNPIVFIKDVESFKVAFTRIFKKVGIIALVMFFISSSAYGLTFVM